MHSAYFEESLTLVLWNSRPTNDSFLYFVILHPTYYHLFSSSDIVRQPLRQAFYLFFTAFSWLFIWERKNSQSTNKAYYYIRRNNWENKWAKAKKSIKKKLDPPWLFSSCFFILFLWLTILDMSHLLPTCWEFSNKFLSSATDDEISIKT